MMQLSDRLGAIVDMAGDRGTAADIGTDHGFVPIALTERGKAQKAYACDVRSGPLERARQHVEDAGLREQIECRLGDGLGALRPGEARLIIIAGMGGELMARILREGRNVLETAEELVLSPHTDAGLVRRTVTELGFFIDAEVMVKEEGKFYVVIRALRGGSRELTDDELDFGPCLLRDRPETFTECLELEAEKAKRIILRLREEEPSDAVSRALLEKEAELERLRKLLAL